MRYNKSLFIPISGAPSRPFICHQCLFQRHVQQQRRNITRGWLQKQDEAKEQWEARRKEIKENKRQSMFSILEERGYIKDTAGEPKSIDWLMNNKRLGVYVGVDPTAASLHVGHMLPLMALFWMHLHGFHTCSLLGGATAKIGDPTGRTTNRPEMSKTERNANLASMHYQLKKLWINLEKIGAKHGYGWEKYWRRELTNNATWWNKLPFLDVMRLLGRGLRLGPMLSRDTVKNKMESGDGMSYSEFAYPVMQAWDWWHMYDTKGIQMQIGGADQYGNIVAGIEAIKYIAKTHHDPEVRQEDGVTAETTPYGFTVPLLTTASGEKFGKSAGNAIWLDAEMTPVFDLYGFFVRTADADVERYLKLFTFMPVRKIQSLMDKHHDDPSKRLPQHALASEFCELVHGEEATNRAEAQHRALFSAKPTLSSLTASLASTTASSPSEAATASTKPANPLLTNQNPNVRLTGTFSSPSLNPFAEQTNAQNAPTKYTTLPKSLVYNTPIARVLYSAGLVTSRSEGHRLAASQGAYVGSRSDDSGAMSDDLSFTPAKLHDPMQTWRYVIKNDDDHASTVAAKASGEEGLLILRVGKWKVKICRIVSDAAFEQMGIDVPGWRELKASAIAKKAEVEGKKLQEEYEIDKEIREEERLKSEKEALGLEAGVDKRASRKEEIEATYEGVKKGLSYFGAADGSSERVRRMRLDLEEETAGIQRLEDERNRRVAAAAAAAGNASGSGGSGGGGGGQGRRRSSAR